MRARSLVAAIGGKSKMKHVDLCIGASGARDFGFMRLPKRKRQATMMISPYRSMLLTVKQ